MIRCALFLIPFILFSCAGKEEPKAGTAAAELLFFNSGEFGPEWINQQLLQPSSAAHSGKHVCVTDSSNIYSLGLHKALRKISSKKLLSVTMKAWVYAEPSISLKDLSFVASLKKGNKDVFWSGPQLGASLKGEGKWIPVSQTVSFPDTDTLPADLDFVGYLLNNTGNRILVDDLEFSFKEK